MRTLIIFLFITNIITLFLLIRQTRYSKQLFKRAWWLELKLIDIYHRSSEETQEYIAKIINNIKPL